MLTFPLTLWKEPQPIGALTVVQPAMPQVENVASQQFPYFFAPERFFKSHSLEESLHSEAEVHALVTDGEHLVACLS